MSIEEIIEDWATVKKRWEAWWQREIYDRVPVQVTAPRDGIPPFESEEVDPKTQWTDVDFMIRRMSEQIRTTYYGGEALPYLRHAWSAGHSLYFGCEPHFESNTVWVDPAPLGKDGYPSFDGWRESPWWKWMLDSTEQASRASKGRYYVWPGWGNHAGDNLSLVRGTERLLMDIALDPEWVKRAVKTISDIQIEVFEELWRLVSPELTGVEGSIFYPGCWSPTRTMAFDCDVSCMFSNEVFRETFLPPLVETMHTVDHRIYHLDGPGAFHHLDTLLDLPELQAIQWVAGAGHREITQWIPLIQRIQSKGKGVQVGVTPEEIEPLLREVRPEGLLIRTSCETEDRARQLLDRVAALF